jgi:hypothetical protein
MCLLESLFAIADTSTPFLTLNLPPAAMSALDRSEKPSAATGPAANGFLTSNPAYGFHKVCDAQQCGPNNALAHTWVLHVVLQTPAHT